MELRADAEGNTYITGRFSERFTAPANDDGTPFTFISNGTFDIFVAKYNADGQRLWIRQYGGDQYDTSQAITIQDNHYYLTGFFNGMMDLGENTLMSNGDFDLFAAKFDESGTVVWATNAGGAYSDLGTAIDLDASGNLYLTGSFEDTAFFDDQAIEAKGSTDFYLTKINSNEGNFEWIRQAGSDDSDIGLGIATDENGTSHVTGVFNQMFIVEGDTLENHSDGNGAIFLLQYNSNGQLQWKSNSMGGSYDEGMAIAIDKEANCYLTGGFSKDLTIGGNTLDSNGNSDLFVAKIKGNFTDIAESLSNHSPSLQIYPNPTHDQLFIEFEIESSDIYSLQLTDYAGRVIYSHFFENTPGIHEQQLDVSKFSSGIYMLQLKSNQMNITQKVIIN